VPPNAEPQGAPLRKGQTVQARITSLAPGGEGITKDFGIPIFVNRVAPGDLVSIRLFDVRKQFAHGEAMHIIEPSPTRAEPPCPLFKVCGGCHWQHMGYRHQLEAKTDIVKQSIKHIAKLDPDELVSDCMRSPDLLSYRNKAQFPVQQVKQTGRILAGYYKQNSHELVNIKHCPIQPEAMDRALETTKQVLQFIGISAYDETTRTGMVRHINERYSFAHKQILLTIVLNIKEDALPQDLRAKLETAAAEIMKKVPEVIGVSANLNRTTGNRIMGDTTVQIAGEQYITETIRSALPHAPAKLKEGIDFRISPTSFFQINSEQATHLFDQMLLAATDQLGKPAAEATFDKKLGVVIDAYSGVGTMGMWLSSISDRVLGIEEMTSSVQDGIVNLKINNITNMEFVEAKVENYAPKLLSQGIRADVVVVDPPRKGLHADGLRALVQLNAKRIVYVSCNPATLARDLRMLEDSGYKTKRVQPIDMFPQTYHVESVTLLEKTSAEVTNATRPVL
jgi:23S rRNA (uracil1939-C5)-methyltransferase